MSKRGSGSSARAGGMDEIKKRRQKERDAKPDYELGMGIPGGNKEYRKTARNSRLVSRMQSRRRR